MTVKVKKRIGATPKKEIGGLPLRKYMEIGKLAMKQTNIACHECLITARNREKNVIKIEIPINSISSKLTKFTSNTSC